MKRIIGIMSLILIGCCARGATAPAPAKNWSVADTVEFNRHCLKNIGAMVQSVPSTLYICFSIADRFSKKMSYAEFDNKLIKGDPVFIQELAATIQGSLNDLQGVTTPPAKEGEAI